MNILSPAPIAALLVVILSLAAQDPFAPFLDGKAPVIEKELPTTLTAPEGVRVREVLFATEPGCLIYAVIATPTWGEKHPGILVLHGGGGSAEVDNAMAWAQRGYVAVAPDLPGIAQPEKISRSTGPWTGTKYGDKRYVANPSAKASLIYHAVLSGIRGFDLLANQPSIDKKRIGIVGISWGGYMTTMLSGLLGDRVRAAFAVYGCGFYDINSQAANLAKMATEERAQWLAWLDAGRRAPGIRAAFFTAAAANDFFFWPLSVQATQDAIPGERNLVYAPNANHKIPLPGGSVAMAEDTKPFVPTPFQPYPTPTGGKGQWLSMELPWFEYHLRDRGKAFPRVPNLTVKADGSFSFTVATTTAITNARICYSRADEDWKVRAWKEMAVEIPASGPYAGRIPVVPGEPFDAFTIVSDDGGASVSSRFVTVGNRLTNVAVAPVAAIKAPAGGAGTTGSALWLGAWKCKENGTVAKSPESGHPTAQSWKFGFEKFPFGWIQRTDLAAGSLNAAAQAGLRFMAKADIPGIFQLNLVGMDEAKKQITLTAPFDAKSEWTEIRLPYASFKAPAGTTVEGALPGCTTVQFVIRKKDTPSLTLWLDEVGVMGK